MVVSAPLNTNEKMKSKLGKWFGYIVQFFVGFVPIGSLVFVVKPWSRMRGGDLLRSFTTAAFRQLIHLLLDALDL